MIISYFCWLTLCLFFLGLYYYEQQLFQLANDDENWEEELVSDAKKGDNIQIREDDGLEAELVLPEVDTRSSQGCNGSEEPSMKAARRDFCKKDFMEKLIYESGERRNFDGVCSLYQIIC